MSFKPEFSEHEWVVVGSGPSGPEWLKRILKPSHKVACVNGSAGVLPNGRRPDTYALFEGAAVGAYGPTFSEMKKAGVFTMARRIVRKETGEKPDCEIDVGWGSECGYDKDRIASAGDGGFLSGGVELLHAVAHRFRPPVVHVVGFDGYEPRQLHADLAGPAPARDAQWCERANAHMSEHIAGITQHYSSQTQFIFYGPCIHKRPDWQAEFIG